MVSSCPSPVILGLEGGPALNQRDNYVIGLRKGDQSCIQRRRGGPWSSKGGEGLALSPEGQLARRDTDPDSLSTLSVRSRCQAW